MPLTWKLNPALHLRGVRWPQMSKLHGLQCHYDGRPQSNKWLAGWPKFTGEMANVQFKDWLFHTLDAPTRWAGQGWVWSFCKGKLLVRQTDGYPRATGPCQSLLPTELLTPTSKLFITPHQTGSMKKKTVWPTNMGISLHRSMEFLGPNSSSCLARF